MAANQTLYACPDCGSQLQDITSPVLTWELGTCDRCKVTWVIAPGESGAREFSRVESEADDGISQMGGR